jgi:polyribonucleotide nucleotidyltransferase
MIHNVTSQIGSISVTIETGKLAKLADGAVTVRCGETIVIVTAVSATTLKEGQDWFPLSVDYREKAAAVGKFPGGYFKREGRPSEKEILTARMTDRPLRPLFPKGYLYDTQIMTVLLSADGQNDPDMLSINGASAALMVSDIPFAGPVAAVRVGRINGEFIANPTHSERENSDLDLVYVGTKDEVIMIEGAANELPEEEFIKAMEFGHAEARKLVDAQIELAAKVGKTKRQVPLMLVKDELLEIAYAVAGDRIDAAIYTSGKVNRSKAVDALKQEVKGAILEKYPEATGLRSHKPSITCRRKPPCRHSRPQAACRRPRSRAIFASFPLKSVCFRAPTALRSLPVAKRRRSPSPPSLQPTRRRISTDTLAAKPPSVSFCTTTSRPSASARPVASVA